MRNTTHRAGERRFGGRLRNFFSRNYNAEELRTTERMGHSPQEESTSSKPPELTANDRRVDCDPSDTSESTRLADGSSTQENSEQSGRRKILSMIREAPQKISDLGDKTKGFLKQVRDRAKGKFPRAGSCVSDNPRQDSDDQILSSDSNIREGWMLPCAEQCKEEKGSLPFVQNTFRDAHEQVIESIDISGFPCHEDSPKLVAIVCSPSEMDPEMVGYFCEGIGISETEIDLDDIILIFCASSLGEVSHAVHLESIYYYYTQPDDAPQGRANERHHLRKIGR